MGSWWYVSNGERKGPVNEDELSRLLSSGALTFSSLLWKAGMKDWEPAANIPELKSLLSSIPPEVPTVQGVQPPTAWQRLKRHLGSTVALVVGGLALLSGLAKAGDPLIAGIVIILGALAYRSAKKRKLGEVNSTLTRQLLEVALLVVMCLAILAQSNLSYLVVTDPVSNAVIPIWAIIAYLSIVLVPNRWLRRSPAQKGL